MIASLRAELFKLRKRATIWVLGAVWMVLTLVFGYLFPYLSYRGTPAGPAAPGAETADQVLAKALPSGLVSSSIEGFPLFAGALALIFGVLVAGSEYGWQTMKVLLTQGPRRMSVLAGKFCALLLMMLTIVLATFAVSALASWLVATIASKPMDWPSAAHIVRGILAGWLIVGMWAAFGMFLAFLVRGTVLAVGVGLVWGLAIENLLRLFTSIGAIDFLQRWLPGTNAGSLAGALGVIAQGQSGGTPGVTTAVGGARAALVLAAYLAVFTVISAVLLQRRDVN